MSEIDDGGPAFPTTWDTANNATLQTDGGMTLRDWFAGQALGSIPLRSWEQPGRTDQQVIRLWAECAYAVADAMLAARKHPAS